MSLIKNLGHVGIICDDLMKVRDFYTRVMGLTVTDENLEVIINEEVEDGWAFGGIQFAMREASKRPSMAFLIFTQVKVKEG